MNEIRRVGPSTPSPLQSEAELSSGGVPRPRYAEVAELKRLQAQFGRLHDDVRVPPTEAISQLLGSVPRRDSTFPSPGQLGASSPMDMARLHTTVRAFLAGSPGGGDGPRQEMVRVLESWCRARETLTSRIGGRG